MAYLLICDDDMLHRDFSATVLERAGHRTAAFESGTACLRHLHEIGGHGVDAVISDIFMPDMDGIEVMIALNKDFPHVPVIGATGGVRGLSRPYGETLEKLGAADVLYKPFSAQELLLSVEKILAARRRCEVPHQRQIQETMEIPS